MTTTDTGTVTGAEAPAAACCPTTTLQTCCAPEDKGACCGTPADAPAEAPSSCGCR
ncbi:hypothetical protein HS041_23690 [Planomonospora sp. ID67723]|uniref:hypothetical protein n=1 Tax=Planomonospora sp. ID67723 TaxID=2738134 RepID=UPI0018C41D35|nr:hypothetical protein [Planomonospora sp. ID67723]MBG0830766.1 hypothetical protein [Planomonospora sp. ID67723]